LHPFYKSSFKKCSEDYVKIVEQNLQKLCLQEEDENGEIKVHTIGKNELLNDMKKELTKRGRYSEVDQKCLSSKTFNNLMESNQLFKGLKVEKTAAGANKGHVDQRASVA